MTNAQVGVNRRPRLTTLFHPKALTRDAGWGIFSNKAFPTNFGDTTHLYISKFVVSTKLGNPHTI
jgi:hypothetical protein